MYIQSVNVGKPQMRPRNGSDVLTGGDKQPVPGAFLHSWGFDLVDLPEFGDSERTIFARRLAGLTEQSQ